MLYYKTIYNKYIAFHFKTIYYLLILYVFFVDNKNYSCNNKRYQIKVTETIG